MSRTRRVLYVLLALAICLLAPQIRLHPPDDLRIAKSFLVMGHGSFHLARPHLARAYSASRRGGMTRGQEAEVLALYGLMLERDGKTDEAGRHYERAAQLEPGVTAWLAALRRALP